MSLRYLDRSRYETGLARCQRLRYLRYHAGPSGYGLQVSRRSMPLLTGGGVADALAGILTHVKDTDSLDKIDPVIRYHVTMQTAAYRDAVETHGLTQLGEVDAAATERVIFEQCALLTGLVWTWCLEILPGLHAEHKIIDVECEEEYVISCTCGLGDGLGTFAEHEARECSGIGLQARADFITERRETLTLATHDHKTTSWPGQAWEEKWETSMQFAIGMICIERRLGREIQEHYVHGLFKGSRRKKKDYATDSYVGPKFQDSPFCVGYCRPGQAGLEADDWKMVYQWWDPETGKLRRLGRTYQKRTIAEYPHEDASMDVAEYWVRALPTEERQKQVQLLGPLNRQALMMACLPREIAGEEGRWSANLGDLFVVAQDVGPSYWTDDRFQNLLDLLIPKSYECRRYGKEQQCEMVRICFREPGWENPFEDGLYGLRAPHHEAERAQMESRGLAPGAEQEEEG